jgi:hypothetical protein
MSQTDQDLLAPERHAYMAQVHAAAANVEAMRDLTEGQRAALALDRSIKALRKQAGTCLGHSYGRLLERVADGLADLYERQVEQPIALRCGDDDAPLAVARG